MTVPSLHVTSASALSLDVDVVVIGVQKTDAGPLLLTHEPSILAMQDTLPLIGVTGAIDEVRRVPAIPGSPRSLAFVGLGSKLGTNELRYASGSAARQLRGVESIAIALPTESAADALAVLEGAAIGAYSFSVYKTPKPEARFPATSVTVVTAEGDGAQLAARAAVVATAVHTVRDLVNEPPSHLYPETLAAAAVELTGEVPVEAEVFDVEALREGGFGGILGVGQGSVHPPRLVKLSYSPAEATTHLALVGKGITFDSGGITLKPSASLVGMKDDMTGAATVLATIVAIARLGINTRVTAWLCIAENMPSGSAMKPNDILTIRGGKTVEVLNTDAEGRLVMADGLVAASEEHPDYIIDVATLTGAQVVALGNRYGGVMGDTEFVGRVVDTATGIGETLWPLPLPADLRPALNSEVADLVNQRPGNTAGGMLVAGLFLSEFVGSTGEGDEKRTIPWAHIDIAGPAENKGGGYGFTGKGPTGVAVRTLVTLTEELSVR